MKPRIITFCGCVEIASIALFGVLCLMHINSIATMCEAHLNDAYFMGWAESVIRRR